MPFYQTKPVEALKFTGEGENTSKILHLIFKAGQTAEWNPGMEAWAHENGIEGYPGTDECIVLTTPRGPLFVYKGSWFVKTRDDHVEVMEEDTFRKLYDEAPGQEAL